MSPHWLRALLSVSMLGNKLEPVHLTTQAFWWRCLDQSRWKRTRDPRTLQWLCRWDLRNLLERMKSSLRSNKRLVESFCTQTLSKWSWISSCKSMKSSLQALPLCSRKLTLMAMGFSTKRNLENFSHGWTRSHRLAQCKSNWPSILTHFWT